MPRSKSGASKSRPLWAAHTRIGNVWEYPPPGGPPLQFGPLHPRTQRLRSPWPARLFKPACAVRDEDSRYEIGSSQLCVFTSSNQSALWSCLRHLTSQVGEGCSMSFVRFVLLMRWKTCVWNSFGTFFPMGFWRILQECEVCSKLSSGNAYVHMLES